MDFFSMKSKITSVKYFNRWITLNSHESTSTRTSWTVVYCLMPHSLEVTELFVFLNRNLTPNQWVTFRLPETRRMVYNNSREFPTLAEEVAPRVEEQRFNCVCGKSFFTLRDRNIHRGRMKCDWASDSSSGTEPVNSREIPSQDQNHSARDIQRLLSEKHGVSPPAGRNEKICWPASNDKAWLEFDDRVCEKLKVVQKNKPFQEKMKVHCEVVYEEAVRWFGVVEKPKKTVPGVVFGNRRQKRIDSLVKERRSLRKKLKRASSDVEKKWF